MSDDVQEKRIVVLALRPATTAAELLPTLGAEDIEALLQGTSSCIVAVCRLGCLGACSQALSQPLNDGDGDGHWTLMWTPLGHELRGLLTLGRH